MIEPHILVVEDEVAIREMLSIALTKAHFKIEAVANVQQAQDCIFHRHLDLILLDWMLPGMSGLEFARQLKRQPRTHNTPIILLTAKGEESDKVRGLEVGADDYVTKPFSIRELIARIKAVLRRTTASNEANPLVIKTLQLDFAEHRVTVDKKEVSMGPTEFRLLQFFMQHPERAYSRNQVLDQVWGSHVYIEERTVDVHIRRLRKALANYGYDDLIQTVRGVGYRFSTREQSSI